MYKLILLVILTGLLQKVDSQPPAGVFVFSGKVANTSVGYVYLNYTDSSRRYREDSCKLTNGQFKFKGYINGPVIALFRGTNLSMSRDDPKVTDVFIEPGNMQGYFPQNDFKHSTITGSKSQHDYSGYVEQRDLLDTQWKPALDALEAAGKNIDAEKNRAVWSKAQPAYLAEKTQLSRRFIRSHPQSHVSAYLLTYEMYKLSHDSLRFYFSQLSPAVRSGMNGNEVSEFIRKEEAIAIGRPAPDFMQPDTSGTPVWLHDYKGKYVLLDLWASWCKPCREEHPNLRQAYEKYSGKGLAILSLSLDRAQDKTAWIEAIKKDSLTWPQLCDFTAMQNKVVEAYNVLNKGIPFNFLIGPDGNIVAMNLRGEAIDKTLATYVK